jgi:hypothetical protein
MEDYVKLGKEYVVFLRVLGGQEDGRDVLNMTSKLMKLEGECTEGVDKYLDNEQGKPVRYNYSIYCK